MSNKSRIPSPARSHGAVTPRRYKPRKSRSVGSPSCSIGSTRLAPVVKDVMEMSPMIGRSVLNDGTDIIAPGRKSWWKNLDENSREVLVVLQNKEMVDAFNVLEDLDVEILSQGTNNYSVDLQNSSDEDEDEAKSEDVENNSENAQKQTDKKSGTMNVVDGKSSQNLHKTLQDNDSSKTNKNNSKAELNISKRKNRQSANDSKREGKRKTIEKSNKSTGKHTDAPVTKENMEAININEVEQELEQNLADIQKNPIMSETVKSPELVRNKQSILKMSIIEGRNTSVRKTKSIIPVRDSIEFSDGNNSSANNTHWDSHRTTRHTMRQTFGKDFTPRKSLRTLVMEKSAKRQTNLNDNEEISKMPQANSTEYPEFESVAEHTEVEESIKESGHTESEHEVSDHDVSNHLESTNEVSDRAESDRAVSDDAESDHEETEQEVSDHVISDREALETYLQKIKLENIEKKRKMEEEIRNSLKTQSQNAHIFKVPLKPAIRRIQKTNTEPKKYVRKPAIPLALLPDEILEDLKFKPPKRYQPKNASWATKRLYKFLEFRLMPKYDYKARVRAEILVEMIYNFTRDIKRLEVAPQHSVDALKHEMARLNIVITHFEFYEFIKDYMPMEVRHQVVPSAGNNIPLPKPNVYAHIIQ